jgi:hypothetical protein
MNTDFIIGFLGLIVFGLTFLLAILYTHFAGLKKEHQITKMINEFLLGVTGNGSGPTLNLLTKMDINILKGLEHQLANYYVKNFLSLISKQKVSEIENYVKAVNSLPDSLQKEFIKQTLKRVIFSQEKESLTDFVFRTIQLICTTSSEDGMALINFLMGDVNYLKERREYIIIIMDGCEELLTKRAITGDLKELMLHDFNDIIQSLNYKTIKNSDHGHN